MRFKSRDLVLIGRAASRISALAARCAYWARRENLRSKYEGLWIGFADGTVITSGSSPVQVLHAAQRSGKHPFVTCVGREDAPQRMRHGAYSYGGSTLVRSDSADYKRAPSILFLAEATPRGFPRTLVISRLILLDTRVLGITHSGPAEGFQESRAKQFLETLSVPDPVHP